MRHSTAPASSMVKYWCCMSSPAAALGPAVCSGLLNSPRKRAGLSAAPVKPPPVSAAAHTACNRHSRNTAASQEQKQERYIMFGTSLLFLHEAALERAYTCQVVTSCSVLIWQTAVTGRLQPSCCMLLHSFVSPGRWRVAPWPQSQAGRQLRCGLHRVVILL